MLTVGDLRKIARARLEDAMVLRTAKRYDGAVYLCGYAVEIGLKARICRTLKWTEYPSTVSEFQRYQSFRTHDLRVLLHLSGREVKIKGKYLAEWSTIASWGPQHPVPHDWDGLGFRCHGHARVGQGAVGGVMNIDINEFRKFMDDIAAERGEFSLFGLFLRDEAGDNWDLVVSAPWLEEGKLMALREFAKELSAAIGEDKVLSLSRIVTLNPEDPALDAIVRLGVSGGTVELRDTDVFGLKFKRAYILRAKRLQHAPSSAT